MFENRHTRKVLSQVVEVGRSTRGLRHREEKFEGVFLFSFVKLSIFFVCVPADVNDSMNEEKISTLVQLGFPVEEARNALLRTNGSLASAIDLYDFSLNKGCD